MIKIMAAVRRKPGMTHQEFCEYVREVHGGIARAKPMTLRKYIQNHVFDSAFGAPSDSGYGQTFHRDSVTELWFDDLPAMGKTFADPYTQQVVGPDGKNFADLATSVTLLTKETIVDVPNRGKGAVKVMHFLKSASAMTKEAFVAAWSQALQEALAKAGGNVRRCVQSTPLDLPPQIAAYFNSEAGETYDGITGLWFDEDDALASLRAFLQAFEPADLLDESKCFFLMAREVIIFDFTTGKHS